MTGSVALDVVIGLVFVYTLYSLLTTTITEFIAVWIRFRSRFLILGIRRMLDDGSGTKVFSDIFMRQPLIKYLTNGLAWFNKAPAYMSAANFSKNLMETLKVAYPLKLVESALSDLEQGVAGNPALMTDFKKLKEDILKKKKFDEDDVISFLENLKASTIPQITADAIDKIETGLSAYNNLSNADRFERVLASGKNLLGKSETIKHLRSLLDDSNKDLEKFKAHIEQWYDDTMERVTGWFKKWIQVITFFVGFLVAIFFNADTVLIVDILAKDPDARKQMVEMATTYIENHPMPSAKDTTDTAKATKAKLDSLLAVTKEIRSEVESAHSVLGLGWDFPDSLRLFSAQEKAAKPRSTFYEFYLPNLQPCYIELNEVVTERLITRLVCIKEVGKHSVATETHEGSGYVATDNSHFFWSGFWGYFLTAVALSLGAPFWFDLLNKLVKLRTAVQAAPSETSSQSGTAQVAITKRVG